MAAEFLFKLRKTNCNIFMEKSFISFLKAFKMQFGDSPARFQLKTIVLVSVVLASSAQLCDDAFFRISDAASAVVSRNL